MRLDAHEFTGRFLLHVLLPAFQRIRHLRSVGQPPPRKQAGALSTSAARSHTGAGRRADGFPGALSAHHRGFAARPPSGSMQADDLHRDDSPRPPTGPKSTMHGFVIARGRPQHVRRDTSSDVTRGLACARPRGLNALIVPRMPPCRSVREAIERFDTESPKRVAARLLGSCGTAKPAALRHADSIPIACNTEAAVQSNRIFCLPIAGQRRRVDDNPRAATVRIKDSLRYGELSITASSGPSGHLPKLTREICHEVRHTTSDLRSLGLYPVTGAESYLRR